MSFRFSQFLRQLFFPNGFFVLAGLVMLAFWVPAEESHPSLRLLCAALSVASGLLAIRLHSLRVFLIVLALSAQLAVASFAQVSHSVMVLLLAFDFALVLLVEDTFFDWEAVGWWLGLLGVQWTALVIASRWAPGFMLDVARPTFDLGIVRIGVTEIGVGLVLMMLFLRFALSLDAVAAGMVWSLTALLGGLRTPSPANPPTMNEAHLALAIFAMGIAVVERSHWIAYHDELTGLPGRRAFNEALAGLGERFCIAVVDVDHFKKFNDTFGHDTGDQVLRKVARHLANVGGGGTAYRCGGEEFAIVFAQRGNEESATHVEGLRYAIEQDVFVARGPARSERERADRRETSTRRKQPAAVVTRVTVSVGMAECLQRRSTAEEVLLAADKALYQAKHNGRNRVELAPKPPVRARSAAVLMDIGR